MALLLVSLETWEKLGTLYPAGLGSAQQGMGQDRDSGMLQV